MFSGILECANYEIGSGPFSITVFHDGEDGVTLDWVEVSVASSLYHGVSIMDNVSNTGCDQWQ